MAVSVRYLVDDVAAAIDFYREHLDFVAETAPGPGFAMLSRGDLRLLLSSPGSAGGGGRAGGEPIPGGWNRFVVTVEDLEATMARLVADGVRLRGDPVDGRGGRQVLAEDPSGNPIELFEPTPAVGR